MAELPKRKRTKRRALKHWLIRNDISQRQFAESLGVARYTVTRWCNGSSTPNLMAALQIYHLTNGQIGLMGLLTQGEYCMLIAMYPGLFNKKDYCLLRGKEDLLEELL